MCLDGYIGFFLVSCSSSGRGGIKPLCTFMEVSHIYCRWNSG